MIDFFSIKELEALIDDIYNELQINKTILSVHNFYEESGAEPLDFFDRKLAHGFGIACGAHIQLAQHLCASYIGGARYFELKPISKKSNYAEISRHQDIDITREYIKSYFLIKFLAKEFGFGDPDGFIFNLSLGNTIDEIINTDISILLDASECEYFKECREVFIKNINRFKNIDENFINSIPSNIIQSITINPDMGINHLEIIDASKKVIDKYRVPTYLKLYPTLIDYSRCLDILSKIGFVSVIPDREAFDSTPNLDEAVEIVTSLKEYSNKLDVYFAIKLSNTLHCNLENRDGQGSHIHLSGKALLPISLSSIEALLNRVYIDISYSGGVDKYNVKELLEAGLFPVTAATLVLKPSGYDGLEEVANQAENVEVIGKADLRKIQNIINRLLDNPQLESCKVDLDKRNKDPFVVLSNASKNCTILCKHCIGVRTNMADGMIELINSQVLIDECTFCSNCQFFSLEPSIRFKKKITLFDSLEDLNNSTEMGFYIHDDGTYTFRLNEVDRCSYDSLPLEIKENIQELRKNSLDI